MTFRKYIVHFIAECKDCNWHTEDFITGQKAASEHARKHGHFVIAETGHYCEYGTKGSKLNGKD